MKKSITAGIDFGNQSCVLSIPSKYGIDIILNQSSNRKTPTIIGYDKERRYSGEFALQQQMMNTCNTITHLKRLIGLEYNSMEREEISSNVPYSIISLENDGFAGIQLQNDTILRPEQILAYFLKSMLEIIQMKNPEICQLVITVPPWWNENQRRSILHSASIANIKVTSLLNSTTAAAVTYVKIHTDRFPENSEQKTMNVIFIDIGDTSMNVAVASLTKSSIEMKSFASDKKIGGHFFTEKLNEYLIEKVQEKYKIYPKSNKRAVIRFRQETEKVKKALSANPIMMFEVPSLMNDIDVSIAVKREEFNSLFESAFEKVEGLIEEALRGSGLTKSDIYAVEFLGGTSRIPAIKEAVKNFFGNEPMKSLDLDECFAIGAGYVAAREDGYNIGIDTISSVYPHEINVEYLDGMEIHSKNVFERNSKFPSKRTLSVPVVEKNSFVFVSDNVKIGTAVIHTDVKERVLVDVTVLFDSFGLINVCEATYTLGNEEANKMSSGSEALNENASILSENQDKERTSENFCVNEDANKKNENDKSTEKSELVNEDNTSANHESNLNSESTDESVKSTHDEEQASADALNMNESNESHQNECSTSTQDSELVNEHADSMNEKCESTESAEQVVVDHESSQSQELPRENALDTEKPIKICEPSQRRDEHYRPKRGNNQRQVFKATFSYQPIAFLSPAMIAEFADLELAMEAKDKTELEIDNTKNKLESLIFTIESELSRIEPSFGPARDDINNIKAKVASIHHWFEVNEFERLCLADYQSKVSEMNDQINAIFEFKKWQANVSVLDEFLQQLSADFQLVKSDTERSCLKESIDLQREITVQIVEIEEIFALPKSELCKVDVESVEERVKAINRRTEELQEIPIEKVAPQKVACQKQAKSKVSIVNLANDDLVKPPKPHHSLVNPQKSRIKLPPMSPRAREKEREAAFAQKKPRAPPSIVHPQSKVSPRQRPSANMPAAQAKKRNVTAAAKR